MPPVEARGNLALSVEWVGLCLVLYRSALTVPPLDLLHFRPVGVSSPQIRQPLYVRERCAGKGGPVKVSPLPGFWAPRPSCPFASSH